MKKLVGLSLFLIFFVSSARQAYAVCPVCTVAVGAGLGVSRLLGIDDSVVGVWIGGLIFSSGLWLSNWLEKRGWNFPAKKIVSIFVFLIFVIPPLYWANIIGLPGNTIWGIDKILFGTFAGSVLFMSGVILDKFLRNINQGKVYVYYQKVIAPVLLLSLGSFILFMITR